MLNPVHARTKVHEDAESLRLDTSERNNLRPFLGFIDDELAKVAGPARNHRGAKLGKPRFHLWIGQRQIDFLVEPPHDICGRAFWRSDAEPGTRLITRQE